MSFLTKNTAAKASFLSCTLAAILFTIGCEKTPPATDEAASDANDISDIAVVETTATATPSTATSSQDSSDDLVMTTITLDAVNNMLFAPLIKSGGLSAEQVTCLESRDKNLGKTEIDKFYKSQFTDAELKELDKFYISDVGQKLVAFGNEQLLVMNGEEVANPMPPPTEEEIKEIQTFMESPLGEKYTQINNAQGEGSAMEALDAPINAELERCNIDMDAVQPM